MNTILALDASSTTTGWAVLQPIKTKVKLIAFGEIKLKDENQSNNFLALFNQITKLIKHYKPTTIGVEDIYAGPNLKTFKTLAEVRGVIILSLAVNDLSDYFTLNAIQVRKKVFGNSKLKKQEVCELLSKYFKVDLKTKGFDQSDAIAVGMAMTDFIVV